MTIFDQFNLLPVKIRWRILLIGCLALFFISYQFNIKKSVSIVSSYNQLKKNFDTLQDVNNPSESNTSNYSTTNIYSDTISLLNFITAYCEEKDIDVKHISQTSSTKIENATIETNKVILEGSYQSLLEFIYLMEVEKKIASINAACWELYEDRENNRHALIITLYIKHIKDEMH
ncbi:MAG: hypothetical protein P4L41_02850 [Flavipsychrobacter sp.]|nr:hypothetical protein [Flavipsychrobacter sp.]